MNDPKIIPIALDDPAETVGQMLVGISTMMILNQAIDDKQMIATDHCDVAKGDIDHMFLEVSEPIGRDHPPLMIAIIAPGIKGVKYFDIAVVEG